MLRLATPADSQHAYSQYLGLVDEPPAPMLLDYAAVAAASKTYVLESGNTIQGMVTIEHQPPDLILRNLAVRPSCQGKGIGRRMVSWVEDMARRSAFEGVLLWTRAEMTDNIAFYSKLNYIITHTEQTVKANRVFFRKALVQTNSASAYQREVGMELRSDLTN
jgi:GNAT superfamily N-acetyltransferase